MNLENINRNKYLCLEFRPFPKAYSLGNKKEKGFDIDDTYYFGIRIKNVIDPSTGSDIKDMCPQIDLTDTRIRFFAKLQDFILNPERSDFSYNDLLQKAEIDIDVQCLTREDLPELVKPKIQIKPTRIIPVRDPFAQQANSDMQPPMGIVGEKRNYSQMQSQSQQQHGALHGDIVDFEEV